MSEAQHQHMDHAMNQNPGFLELWNPEYIVLVLFLAVVYFRIIGSQRSRYADSTPVTSLQKVSFVTGLFFLYVSIGSPLSYYGMSFLFSAHMLQQSILFMIVPPLLLLGTPAWLIRPFLQGPAVNKVLSIVTQPIAAVTTFNILFSVYHFPFVFDAMMANHLFHNVYHIILFATAFQMWWLITCPIPEMNKLTHLKKMGYIFANGVLLTPACALIIFAGSPLYETYAFAPDLLYFLPKMDDQQLGGVLMKLVQEFAYGTGLWYVFYQWYRLENPTDKIEGIDSVDSIDDALVLHVQPKQI